MAVFNNLLPKLEVPRRRQNVSVMLVFLMTLLTTVAHGSDAPWGVARMPVPVLNVPRMETVFGGRDGRSLKTDGCGQVRELEFVALPETRFRILEKLHRGDTTVLRVATEEYPVPAGAALYVDERFIESRREEPPPRQRSLPPRQRIVTTLRSAVGSPYVWGGNLRDGAPEMASIFYRGTLSPLQRRSLTLAGLDCSGLLYEATGGWSPRNTSALVRWGRGIEIAGKSAGEIAALLEPLDLIVWSGHVIIVLDRETAIESRLECGKPGRGGVVLTPLRRRLAEVMGKRRPVDVWPAEATKWGAFVVRRWLEEEQH